MKTFRLEIISPDLTLYEGNVVSVQLPAKDGLLEVLNQHAPMIATLGSGRIRIKAESGEEYFMVEDGVIEVINNKVIVLIEKLLEQAS